MLVSYSHKFVFLHIPKTGGSSMNAALEPYCPALHRTAWSQLQRELGLPSIPEKTYLRSHDTYRHLERAFGRKIRDYFVFSTVRNPFSHAWSHYNHLKTSVKPVHAARFPNMPFNDFLRLRLTRKGAWRDDSFVRLTDQVAFLSDRSGKVAVNGVSYLESIEEDLATMCEKLGLDEIRMPKLNRRMTKSDAAAAFEDGVSIDLVKKLYARDFDVWGYSRDPSDITAPPRTRFTA